MDDIPQRPVSGSVWRLLAHRHDTAVAMQNEGIFDELVVDPWLHLEQMDTDLWWMRLGDARIMITIDSDGSPSVDIERGCYAPVRGNTTM